MPADYPVELRRYPSGSFMDWHKDEVMYDLPQFPAGLDDPLTVRVEQAMSAVERRERPLEGDECSASPDSVREEVCHGTHNPFPLPG